VKVLVCGGRNYRNSGEVDRVLSDLHEDTPIAVVIEGGARGADLFAASWAQRNEIQKVTVAADWEMYGNAAGPMRNKEMLSLNPDLVVAFPGGRGTANMVSIARLANVKVLEITQ
jgi:hypothetical protein